MEELDYWRLCEELNIVQAALLIVGEDPTTAEYIEQWNVEKRPKGYEAAKTAICSGLNAYTEYMKEQTNPSRIQQSNSPDLAQKKRRAPFIATQSFYYR